MQSVDNQNAGGVSRKEEFLNLNFEKQKIIKATAEIMQQLQNNTDKSDLNIESELIRLGRESQKIEKKILEEYSEELKNYLEERAGKKVEESIEVQQPIEYESKGEFDKTGEALKKKQEEKQPPQNDNLGGDNQNAGEPGSKDNKKAEVNATKEQGVWTTEPITDKDPHPLMTDEEAKKVSEFNSKSETDSKKVGKNDDGPPKEPPQDKDDNKRLGEHSQELKNDIKEEAEKGAEEEVVVEKNQREEDDVGVKIDNNEEKLKEELEAIEEQEKENRDKEAQPPQNNNLGGNNPNSVVPGSKDNNEAEVGNSNVAQIKVNATKKPDGSKKVWTTEPVKEGGSHPLMTDEKSKKGKEINSKPKTASKKTEKNDGGLLKEPQDNNEINKPINKGEREPESGDVNLNSGVGKATNTNVVRVPSNVNESGTDPQVLNDPKNTANNQANLSGDNTQIIADNSQLGGGPNNPGNKSEQTGLNELIEKRVEPIVNDANQNKPDPVLVNQGVEGSNNQQQVVVQVPAQNDEVIFKDRNVSSLVALFNDYKMVRGPSSVNQNQAGQNAGQNVNQEGNQQVGNLGGNQSGLAWQFKSKTNDPKQTFTAAEIEGINKVLQGIDNERVRRGSNITPQELINMTAQELFKGFEESQKQELSGAVRDLLAQRGIIVRDGIQSRHFGGSITSKDVVVTDTMEIGTIAPGAKKGTCLVVGVNTANEYLEKYYSQYHGLQEAGKSEKRNEMTRTMSKVFMSMAGYTTQQIEELYAAPIAEKRQRIIDKVHKRISGVLDVKGVYDGPNTLHETLPVLADMAKEVRVQSYIVANSWIAPDDISKLRQQQINQMDSIAIDLKINDFEGLSRWSGAYERGIGEKFVQAVLERSSKLGERAEGNQAADIALALMMFGPIVALEVLADVPAVKEKINDITEYLGNLLSPSEPITVDLGRIMQESNIHQALAQSVPSQSQVQSNQDKSQAKSQEPKVELADLLQEHARLKKLIAEAEAGSRKENQQEQSNQGKSQGPEVELANLLQEHTRLKARIAEAEAGSRKENQQEQSNQDKSQVKSQEPKVELADLLQQQAKLKEDIGKAIEESKKKIDELKKWQETLTTAINAKLKQFDNENTLFQQFEKDASNLGESERKKREEQLEELARERSKDLYNLLDSQEAANKVIKSMEIQLEEAKRVKEELEATQLESNKQKVEPKEEPQQQGMGNELLKDPNNPKDPKSIPESENPLHSSNRPVSQSQELVENQQHNEVKTEISRSDNPSGIQPPKVELNAREGQGPISQSQELERENKELDNKQKVEVEPEPKEESQQKGEPHNKEPVVENKNSVKVEKKPNRRTQFMNWVSKKLEQLKTKKSQPKEAQPAGVELHTISQPIAKPEAELNKEQNQVANQEQSVTVATQQSEKIDVLEAFAVLEKEYLSKIEVGNVKQLASTWQQSLLQKQDNHKEITIKGIDDTKYKLNLDNKEVAEALTTLATGYAEWRVEQELGKDKSSTQEKAGSEQSITQPSLTPYSDMIRNLAISTPQKEQPGPQSIKPSVEVGSNGQVSDNTNKSAEVSNSNNGRPKDVKVNDDLEVNGGTQDKTRTSIEFTDMSNQSKGSNGIDQGPSNNNDKKVDKGVNSSQIEVGPEKSGGTAEQRAVNTKQMEVKAMDPKTMAQLQQITASLSRYVTKVDKMQKDFSGKLPSTLTDPLNKDATVGIGVNPR